MLDLVSWTLPKGNILQKYVFLKRNSSINADNKYSAHIIMLKCLEINLPGETHFSACYLFYAETFSDFLFL